MCLGWGQRGLARRQAEESLGNRLHGKPRDTCNGLEFTQEAVQLTLQNPYAVQLLRPKMNTETCFRYFHYTEKLN